MVLEFTNDIVPMIFLLNMVSRFESYYTYYTYVLIFIHINENGCFYLLDWNSLVVVYHIVQNFDKEKV